MTIHVDLGGDQWAKLRGVEELTGADQDVAFDAWDRITEAKPQPEPQPDPANPAVMLPAPARRFTNAEGRSIRDTVLGLVVAAWSYDHLSLPYTPEARRQLPLPACNALYKAVDPIQNALLGVEDEAPKASGLSPGSDGSTGTSQESTENPLPAPPAEQSGTPSA